MKQRNIIDLDELSKEYMSHYNALISDFEDQKIDDMVHHLNDAVKISDMDKVNSLYNDVTTWNTSVSNLYGARQALNKQFPYLRLPSPSLYSIVFDQEQKIWMFNTPED